MAEKLVDWNVVAWLTFSGLVKKTVLEWVFAPTPGDNSPTLFLATLLFLTAMSLVDGVWVVFPGLDHPRSEDRKKLARDMGVITVAYWAFDNQQSFAAVWEHGMLVWVGILWCAIAAAVLAQLPHMIAEEVAGPSIKQLMVENINRSDETVE